MKKIIEEGKYAYSIAWNSGHWSSSLAKTVLINPWKNKMYYLIKGEEIVLHSNTTLKILEIETVNKC